MPIFYTSGASLSATDTFRKTTLAKLGLTTGTYFFTFGSGAHADSVVVNIGTVAAVPEPSSLVLMGSAAIAGLGCVWRRRRARVVA